MRQQTLEEQHQEATVSVHDTCRSPNDRGHTRLNCTIIVLPGLELRATPREATEPDLAFVLDDGTGRAVGYILGTADTPRFVTEFRERWLPLVDDRYPRPQGEPRAPADEMIALLHNPERMILPELARHPAHLHIDLLPDWQRKGYGRELMRTFLAALRAKGVTGVHLSMLTANTPARAFYDRLGFTGIRVPDPGPVSYLVRGTEAGL
ncbi:GCN5 family acetyltransferase [Streptomyces sp. CB02488]|uniref:GNAT family N-acetyltransferase n=1 Tax=Streptomyces sp. CB02488 TaxID=1703920 RepID=UPI00093B83D8|nr:GNAT family N-acetyltransferase [Streptomyces sp. CB02488]OKK12915.1 GCN5 family acetyltransferase [Streptomyces sp. CB02488]